MKPRPSSGVAPFQSRRAGAWCAVCALPSAACLCGQARLLEVAAKVIVFVHRREVYKTTNTARLVPLTLRNGELRTVGLPEDRVQYDGLEHDGCTTLLLFPCARSVELTRELCGGRPATLVVPDGNWRQARRIATNEPELVRLQAVHLPRGEPRRFELRRHPEPDRLSTFEAIARALGILEGVEVQRELERVLALKVEGARDKHARRKPSASG